MNQRSVECFVIKKIKDEPVPNELVGFEPGKTYIDTLLANCPFAFTLPGHPDSLPFNDPDPYAVVTQPDVRLHQTSPNHARSLEVHDPQIPSFWTDEYDHRYTSLTLKGNVFADTRLMQTLTAPDGVIAYGLQESSIIQRLLVAGRILAAAGVSTERILGIAEPKVFAATKYPDNTTDYHSFLNLSEYKAILIHRAWLGLEESERTPERLVDYQQKLSRMTFYVTARAMDTSIRLSELQDPYLLERVFDTVNNNFKPEQYRDYSHEDPNDPPRFLQEIVVPRLSTNLAMAHNIGVAFRFPIGQNITALGSPIDLDSSHGAPLGIGDHSITALDIVNDICCAVEGLSSSIKKEFVVFDPETLEMKHDTDVRNIIDLFLDEYFKKFDQRTYHASALLGALDPIEQQKTDGLYILWQDEFLQARGALQSKLLDLLAISDIYHGYATSVPIENMEATELFEDMEKWVQEGLILDEDSSIMAIIMDTTRSIHSILFSELTNRLEPGMTLEDVLLSTEKDSIWSDIGWQGFLETLGETLTMFYFGQHPDVNNLERRKALDSINAGKRMSLGSLAIGKLMSSKGEWFKLMTTINERASLLPDFESISADASRGPDLLYHVNRVSKTDLQMALLMAAPAISSIMMRNKTEPGEEEFLASEPDFCLSEQTGYFSEIITDGVIELSCDASDLEGNLSQVTHIDVELSEEASYVAAVQKNDNGSYDITLLIVGGELDEQILSTDRDEIYRLLMRMQIPLSMRKAKLSQLELFNRNDYTSLRVKSGIFMKSLRF